jgi:putative drug exporter of the RND superfamily
VTATARFTQRYAMWIIGVWVLAAVLANSVAPQLEQVVAAHDQPSLPADAASSVAAQRSAAAFSQAPGGNIEYLVLERDGPLGDRDRTCYDQLVKSLRSDSRHVVGVVDWWGAPVTSDAALSSDRHVATATMRLSGGLGTSQASDSINATRAVVAGLHLPDGLHVFVTGPGAVIADESAVMDRRMTTIKALTVAALLLVLLIIYRSLITAMVPLLSVGLALAVARPIVAVLDDKNLIGVSPLAVALGAALTVGAGTNFAIFLIARYLERRRQNVDSAGALADAYRAVAPVIVGSALTLAIALGCLSLARIGLFYTTGIPCAIGVLTAMLAALTVTPALIALAGRLDLLRPQRQSTARRWRRIGVRVARWPGPILVSSTVLLLVLAIPLLGLRIGWNESAVAPANADSARGYRAVDHHFANNQLLPDAVTIQTDHDIRNPAGLIAVEQITGAIMAIPGVRMVQSASRLNGQAPRQATLPAPTGIIGDRLGEAADRLASRPATFTDLDAALGDLLTAFDAVQNGLQHGTGGLDELRSAARQMQGAVIKLRRSIDGVSDIAAPLRSLLVEVPDCQTNSMCAAVREMVQWVDDVIDGSTKLASGLAQFADGISTSAQAVSGLPLPGAFDVSFAGVAGQLAQARAATKGLKDQLNGVSNTPVQQLPGFLHNLAGMYQGSPNVGYYAALKVLNDPDMRHVLDDFISPDGRATRLLVYGDGHEWVGQSAQLTRAITTAILGATKGGTLAPKAIELTGFGPVTRDLQGLLRTAVPLFVIIALAAIFAIVSLLLTSPIAGLVVVGTVAASYACALGASALFWQHLVGHSLHWSVPPIVLVVLLAAGCGYNLLLARRIREELPAGPHIGIIRAFAATGGVVTAAGIVYGAMMLALASSGVISVAQIGVTVALGLLLDIVIVRSLLLPALMVLLGRWFWWPRRIIALY